MVGAKVPFHIWLKEQRKALDLTQKDLAQRIGCSTVTVKKLEAGELRPSKELATILAQHFGISGEQQQSFVQFARDGTGKSVQPDRGLSALSESTPWERLGRVPNNLPAPPNAFIGRRAEVEAVQVLLQRQGVRLITLTGPPGIGKTRLSLEVAAELAAGSGSSLFADGVYFVLLAPVRDQDLLVPTIARALGVRESADFPLIESLKAHLRSKKMLLILDNFEQIVSAGPVLAGILAAAPRLKAVVTSREVLHIYGEHDFSMRRLSLPQAKETPSTESLLQYDAVKLFIERATSAKLDFSLTLENATAISEICGRLDGLPLAIELAAGHVKTLPVDTLLERLESRLALLVGGPRDLPLRQQTLRGAIAWSYDLLDVRERTLFRLMSVFVGGCTYEAVESIAGELEDPSLRDTLASLADKSLLRQEAGSSQELRYVMLETIREYATERLMESGEAPTAYRLHGVYFMALAERAASELRGPAQSEWMVRLEEEHDNFRAALHTCAQSNDSETALRLASALWHFWHMRGYLTEGREHLSAVLSIPEGGLGDGTDKVGLAVLRAKVLNGAGVFALMQGDHTSATSLYEQSLFISRRSGDKAGIASTLSNLGSLAYYQEDMDKARSLYEESLALYRDLGEAGGMSKSLNNLAIIMRGQGYYGEASALLGESLAMKREAGDKEGISSVLNNMAEVAQLQGDLEWARELFEESLTLRVELGNKRGMAETLEGLANVNALLGMVERAVRLWGAAEALREVIGSPLLSTDRNEYDREVAAARLNLGETFWSVAWSEGRAMSPQQAAAYALKR
ncbi:MAG TPA: tetratricopeptide repeat protein [Chloroflexia bacterium]|nr:tetratricopeptide repeat protein [Chloroflexia bacterium]